MLSNIANVRRQQYMKKGPRKPLFRCQRCDLPNTTWIFDSDLESEVIRQALRRIDPGFEVIYDRHTAESGTTPGHHLYRVIKRGGSALDDSIVLEFSLQEDIDRPWPDGKPKAPGRWLIQAVRDRDKAKMGGNPAYLGRKGKTIEDRGLEAGLAAHEKIEKRLKDEEQELAAHLSTQIDAYAVRNKTFCTVEKAKRRVE